MFSIDNINVLIFFFSYKLLFKLNKFNNDNIIFFYKYIKFDNYLVKIV